jgi:hypothetical protein
MANIPLHFSASVQDGFNVRTTTDAYLDLPDTTTLAQLIAAEGSWLTDVDAIIDGAIINNQILMRPAAPSGLKAATGATWSASRNGYQGLFRWDVTGTQARWSSVLPSISNSVLSGSKINLANTAVSAYVALVATSGNHYTNPQNLQILDLNATAVVQRTKRKQQNSKTSEAG